MMLVCSFETDGDWIVQALWTRIVSVFLRCLHWTPMILVVWSMCRGKYLFLSWPRMILVVCRGWCVWALWTRGCQWLVSDLTDEGCLPLSAPLALTCNSHCKLLGVSMLLMQTHVSDKTLWDFKDNLDLKKSFAWVHSSLSTAESSTRKWLKRRIPNAVLYIYTNLE